MSIAYDFAEIFLVQEAFVIFLFQEGNSAFILVVDDTHDVITIEGSAQLLELMVGFYISFESLGVVEFLFLELVDGIVEVLVFSEDGLHLGEETVIRIHGILTQV